MLYQSRKYNFTITLLDPELLNPRSDMQLSKPSENLRVSRRISMPVVDCVDEKILDAPGPQAFLVGFRV